MAVTRHTWDDYAAAWSRLHGGFDPRLATPVVRGWLRFAYHVGRFLGRLGVTPTMVTGFGLLVCLCVPPAVLWAPGGEFVGAVLVVLAALADSVDGAVAVVTDRTSRLGYVYDSVADRLGEAAWLVAFWLVGAPGALVVLAGALSWLHEYARARAVAAGMKEIGAVTVGERPSRVSTAFVGLLLAGLANLIRPDLGAGVVTLVTAVWILVAAAGLSQLLTVVRRSLTPYR